MGMKCPKCDFENPDNTSFCGNCAAPLRPSEKVPISTTETLPTPIKVLTRGRTFANRYEIIEELGKGGMGKVYKVMDNQIDEIVALKLLKPEVAADEMIIERFRNELKFARKISHRNVCRMHDLSEYEGTQYITMEYVPGEDLKGMIRMMGHLSPGQATSIGKQICKGLAEAHHLGVVHRDLKPRNIMIDKMGSAKIMDFGIARSLKARGITGTGMMIGTPEYMSPEQVEGEQVDARSDIYSFGVILYEMVTGRVPFEGETPISIAVKHKTVSPHPPIELNVQIPENLNDLIMKCMAKDRETRIQTVGEVYSELTRIEEEIPTPERGLPKKKPTTLISRVRPKKIMVPGILALVAILIVAGYFLIDRFMPGKKEIKEEKPAEVAGKTTEKSSPPLPQNVAVEINSTPKGADVYLNDKREGTTPFKHELSPGKYKIRIKKDPGYKEISDALELKTGEAFSKNYTLALLNGTLQISSTPKGADVYLNNKREGKTPFRRELPPGNYRVRINKDPDYKEISEALKVNAGKTSSRNYTLALASQYGSLQIDSRPEGAEVYLGDKREGITPFKRELPPGSYRIKIRKFPEYKEITDVLRINVGKTSSKNYSLTPVYILNLRTAPDGADVRIDGAFKGKTPIQIELAKSTCRLRIEKGNEWSPIDESLTLKPGINYLERPLKRTNYILSIATNPPEARVFVGDKAFGVSPVKKFVSYGVYNIRIEKQGYKTIEESADVRTNVERTYDLARLEPGKIRLKVHPYADVLIDGRLIGEVPPIRIQEIEEGKHTIEFVSTRLNKKFSIEVEIKGGESKEILMNMETGESKVIKLSRLK